MVITEEDKENEYNSSLRKDIGSTLSGTGSSAIRRITRDKKIKLAKDFEQLKPFITDAKTFLHEQLQKGQDILIEGTQGFGLSLLHSPCYPYTTSKDTTAAGFLSEVGLSPFDVDDIILVIRTFPIRVEGNSGCLKNEISWDDINKTPELSSVTKKVRRIAEFDSETVKKAITSNRPTKIVLNHLDYIKKNQRGIFVEEIQKSIGAKINYIGLSNKQLEEIK
jgi:adenylosuccinate synthase